MLTRRQRDLLAYIQACLDNDGVPPSFEEMKDALGLRSKSGVHRLVTALEERGFIRRLPHRARALEVVKPVNRQRPQLAYSQSFHGVAKTFVENVNGGSSIWGEFCGLQAAYQQEFGDRNA